MERTVGVDIETEAGQIWCLGLGDADRRTASRNWRALLNTVEGRTPVFHNAGFDLAYLDPIGDRFGTDFRDSIAEAHMLGCKPLNLADLASIFLTGSPLDKTPVKERKKVKFDERADTVLDMCSADAWACDALHRLWADTMAPYQELLAQERRVTRVLMDMKKTGLPLSQHKLKQARRQIRQRMGSIEVALKALGVSDASNRDAFGQQFWRGKKKIKTTKKGKVSTAAEHLREFAKPEEEDKVELFIEWHQLAKLDSTYISNWMGQDWLHSSLNQYGPATWRFSSSQPNLQNVTRSKMVPLYQLFQAPEGWVFISADYSQLELRILANVTEDPAMIQAYLNDGDLHHSTVQDTPKLWDIWNKGDAVDKDKARTRAKTVNFGIAYLISAYGLAPKVGESESEAQKYIDVFYGKYKRVQPWQKSQYEFARDNGYVKTFAGRPLWIPGIYADEGILAIHAEKQAANYPIQGGAAEIVKDAMVRCPQYLVMQVHDEVLYLVPQKEAEEYKQYLSEALVDSRHTVPYTIEIKMGDTWGQIKRIPDIFEEDDDDE